MDEEEFTCSNCTEPLSTVLHAVCRVCDATRRVRMCLSCLALGACVDAHTAEHDFSLISPEEPLFPGCPQLNAWHALKMLIAIERGLGWPIIARQLNGRETSGSRVKTKNEPETSGSRFKSKNEPESSSGSYVKTKNEPEASGSWVKTKNEPETSGSCVKRKNEPETSASCFMSKNEPETSGSCLKTKNVQKTAASSDNGETDSVDLAKQDSQSVKEVKDDSSLLTENFLKDVYDRYILLSGRIAVYSAQKLAHRATFAPAVSALVKDHTIRPETPADETSSSGSSNGPMTAGDDPDSADPESLHGSTQRADVSSMPSTSSDAGAVGEASLDRLAGALAAGKAPKVPKGPLPCGFMPLRGDFVTRWAEKAELDLNPCLLLPSDSAMDTQLILNMGKSYVAVTQQRQMYEHVIREHLLIRRWIKMNRRKNLKEEMTYPTSKLAWKLRKFSRALPEPSLRSLLDSMKREKELRKRLRQLSRYKQYGLKSVEDGEEFDRLQKAGNSGRSESSNCLSLRESSFCHKHSIAPLRYLALKTAALLVQRVSGVGQRSNPGQRSLVDGQSSLADGQRSLVDGQSSLVDGQSSLVDGQRSLVDVQRSLVQGQRSMGNIDPDGAPRGGKDSEHPSDPGEVQPTESAAVTGKALDCYRAKLAKEDAKEFDLVIEFLKNRKLIIS